MRTLSIVWTECDLRNAVFLFTAKVTLTLDHVILRGIIWWSFNWMRLTKLDLLTGNNFSIYSNTILTFGSCDPESNPWEESFDEVSSECDLQNWSYWSEIVLLFIATWPWPLDHVTWKAMSMWTWFDEVSSECDLRNWSYLSETIFPFIATVTLTLDHVTWKRIPTIPLLRGII